MRTVSMAINHYRLLGVPPDADRQRLKSAYRSLAKRFHPDANNGCEASADLFRQINDAYRILCDPKLRAEYDARQLAKEQAAVRQQSEQQNVSAQTVDSQQKFNHFVDSLLDAIFGPLEQPIAKSRANGRAPPKQRSQARKKPGFSFYYHLEREKRAATYEQGKDGIYRQVDNRKAREPTGKRSSFKRFSRSSFILLVLGKLFSLLNP